MSETKSRIIELDILRGIAAVFVVLGHCIITYPVDFSAVSWCETLSYWINSFHMPMFFVLAGCVYKCTDYGKYIEKKVIRILVPYLFFGMLTVLLHYFGGAFINGDPVPVTDGIKDLLFYGREIWFLYLIFLTYLIYPLLEKILVNDAVKLAFSALLIIINEFVHLPKLLSLAKWVQFLPYFILGTMLKKYVIRFGKVSVLKKIISVFAGIGFAALLGFVDYRTGKTYEFLDYFRAFSIMLALLGIVTLPERNEEKLNPVDRFLCKCSEYSLQFYLFQAYVITVLRFVFCSVLKMKEPLILVPIFFIIMMAACFAGCEISRRIPVVSTLCGFGKPQKKTEHIKNN